MRKTKKPKRHPSPTKAALRSGHKSSARSSKPLKAADEAPVKGQSSTGGGAAAQAGAGYQNRVAAWLCVHILSESGVSSPWDLAVQITLDTIRCEVPLPVDDILIANSANGHGFIQAKHSLALQSSADSDLASAFDQFVRLFLETRENASTSDPTRDPLNITRDRLVLAVGPESSATVTQALRKVLSKLRSNPPDVPLEGAARNATERKALNVVSEHIKRSWQQVVSGQPSIHELKSILSLVWIHQLDVDKGGQGEREAQAILRNSVLVDPDQAELAWKTLVVACGEFATARTGADRQQLREASATLHDFS